MTITGGALSRPQTSSSGVWRIFGVLLPFSLVLWMGFDSGGTLLVSAIATLLGGGIAILISRSHRRAMGATRSPKKSEILLTTMGGAGLTSVLFGAAAGGANAAGEVFGGSLLLSLIAAFGWWALIRPDAPGNTQRDPASGSSASAIRDEAFRAGSTGRQERECPSCAEPILMKARVCKHCDRAVDPSYQSQAL